MNDDKDINSKPLYNSRLIDNYIKIIKKKYPEVGISEVLDYAGMRLYQVADQAHWFTQDQIDRFYERVVEVTGDDGMAREAGRYSASPDALGIMRQYVLGLVGPANTFKLIGQGSSNFTRSASYRSESLGENKVQITVTPHEGVNEKIFQCQNRLGFWEAVVTMMGYKSPQIEHPQCLFRGDAHCTYIVSWEKSASVTLRKLRVFLSVLCLPVFFFPWMKLSTNALLIGFASFFSSILIVSLLIEMFEKKEILKNVSNIRDSTDLLIEQTNRNYNNALMANEIGQAISTQANIKQLEQSISGTGSIDEILKEVIFILNKRLDYDRGMILLANRERTRLVFRAGYGYSEQHQDLLRGTSFHLDNPDSKGAFVVSFHQHEPFLINDLSELEDSLSPRSRALAEALGVHSFICCPIICDGEAIGILAVDNTRSKRPLIHSDLTLLMGIAPVIGISIHNADLMNGRRKQFHSLLMVLATSIDARDPMTAGHSEKVTEYSVGICRELGQSEDFSEMIRVAALLHDYGKIAVPDAILKKPGRLSHEEYQIVKTHSEKTREILDQINFEGIYQCVPEVAGGHHEKLDGSGYPLGLKGDEIHLGSKIIAVADFFEAITAKRHYREPMPLSVAFQILREESGIHFDNDIIEALIRYYEKKYSLGSVHKVPERKSQRVPYQTSVFYTVDGHPMTGTSADISVRGIFIATDRTVNEGETIELSFAIPSSVPEIYEASGRVAWVNGKNKPLKGEMPAGFGVEFLNLNKRGLDAVFGYVSESHLAPMEDQPG